MLGLWLPIHTGDALVLNLTVSALGASVDLSDVASAVVAIEDPAGNETTMTSALSNQTATTLTLTAAFNGADPEIAQSGRHVIVCLLTMNDATITKTLPFELPVRAQYEVVGG